MNDFREEKLVMKFKDFSNLVDISTLGVEIHFLEIFKDELINIFNLDSDDIKINIPEKKEGSVILVFSIIVTVTPIAIKVYFLLKKYFAFKNFLKESFKNNEKVILIKTENSKGYMEYVIGNEKKDNTFTVPRFMYKWLYEKKFLNNDRKLWKELSIKKTDFSISDGIEEYSFNNNDIRYISKNFLKINKNVSIIKEITILEEKKLIISIISINYEDKKIKFYYPPLKKKIIAKIIDPNFNPNNQYFSSGKYMKIVLKIIRNKLTNFDEYEDEYEVTQIIDSNFKYYGTNILEMTEQAEELEKKY
ncbi:MAG: hypothetical protein HPAVJP_2270 [Candidatus Hepatoplasma vulgare]|nr:MAG: hypothetical protein HPAVJP_2270 [Candidatus Hepatoplasma sp.]